MHELFVSYLPKKLHMQNILIFQKVRPYNESTISAGRRSTVDWKLLGVGNGCISRRDVTDGGESTVGHDTPSAATV